MPRNNNPGTNCKEQALSLYLILPCASSRGGVGYLTTKMSFMRKLAYHPPCQYRTSHSKRIGR
eukprot:3940906-Rhodomonas_salina.2